MSTLCFAPLAPQHLDACVRIAATAPDPWGRESLEKAEDGESHRAFVALCGDEVAAFACFFCSDESADLQMIAVDAACRRRGIARRLLQYALPQMQGLGATRVLLEARVSNAAAIALYQQLGFKTLARRPGMYARPAEDGVLMALPLGNRLNFDAEPKGST